MIRGVFGKSEMDNGILSLENLRLRYAEELGMQIDDYDSRICQWRDLWSENEYFDKLLRDKRLTNTVQFYLQEPSIQLLHDHIIRKPSNSLNSTIPWHQDYPFWPVDTPNSLSCWLPLEGVSEKGGCLEVVDKSHSWGISPPVDFIMDPVDYTDREDILRIPVNRGDIVVLHSLTWHRTGPNLEKKTNRPAHITLWLPSYARYRPDLADWHPVNDRVTVSHGEFLNEDWFPRFGSFDPLKAPPPRLEHLHDGPIKSEDTMDMFSATPRITNQISKILGEDKPTRHLTGYVSDLDVRNVIFLRSVEENILDQTQRDWLEDIFDQMLINSNAFVKHRARNVYNDAYAQWWFHLGSKWVTRWS